MSRDWTEQIYGDMESINIDDVIKEKEKQIERLQEQLKEANDIIKKYVETTPKVPNDGFHIPNYNLDNAECYLEKWGVK